MFSFLRRHAFKRGGYSEIPLVNSPWNSSELCHTLSLFYNIVIPISYTFIVMKTRFQKKNYPPECLQKINSDFVARISESLAR